VASSYRARAGMSSTTTGREGYHLIVNINTMDGAFQIRS